MKALALQNKQVKIPHVDAYDFGTGAFSAMAIICPKAIQTAYLTPPATEKPIMATGTIVSNRSSVSGPGIHDYNSYRDYVAKFPPAGGAAEIEKHIKENYQDEKNFEDGLDKGDWSFSITSQRTAGGNKKDYFLNFKLRTLHSYNTGGIGYELIARIPSFYQDKHRTTEDDATEPLDKLMTEYAYHVAAVRDDQGAMSLYLNGYLLAEVSLNVENNGGFGTYQLKTLIKKDISKTSQYIVVKQQDGKSEIKLEKPNDQESVLLPSESSNSFWRYDDVKSQEFRELNGTTDTPYKNLRITKQPNTGEDAQQTTLSILADGKLLMAYRPVFTPQINVNNKCDFQIGSFSPDSTYGKLLGNIRKVSLWNKALSQKEIIDCMYNPSSYEMKVSFEPQNFKHFKGPKGIQNKFQGTLVSKFIDMDRVKRTGSKPFEIIISRENMTSEDFWSSQEYQTQKANTVEIAKKEAPNAEKYQYDATNEQFIFERELDMDNCVGYWKFDDNGEDSSNTGNNVPASETMTFKDLETILPYFMEDQKADYWCWAASSVSTAKFFNPLTEWKQCSLATTALKTKGPTLEPPIIVSIDCNCCNNLAADPTKDFQTSDECNKGFALSVGLEVAGNHFYKQKPYLTNNLLAFEPALIMEIKEELNHRRPVGVVLKWGGVEATEGSGAVGQGHFVFIIGIQEDKFVIADSFNGVSLVPQSGFPTTYKMAGTSIPALYFTKA